MNRRSRSADTTCSIGAPLNKCKCSLCELKENKQNLRVVKILAHLVQSPIPGPNYTQHFILTLGVAEDYPVEFAVGISNISDHFSHFRFLFPANFTRHSERTTYF